MTQHEVQRTDFGPSWPEVAGFGEGTPQQAIFEFSVRENLKNVQVSIHLPCLLVFADGIQVQKRTPTFQQGWCSFTLRL